MRVALFIGNHADSAFLVKLSAILTRKFQKGPYSNVVHVEAIHEEFSDGSVTIASASYMDKGVRSKITTLNPLHWIMVDVPQWDVELSQDYLSMTVGMPYDSRGALATCLPGSPDADKAFCNQWVGHPFLKASATFGPHHFAAICLTIGKDITKEFFASRI